jgi:hypothetical protein
MYTQFFGNFLLGREIITPTQLLEVMSAQKSTRIKIGTLAMHAGYMTAKEVEQILAVQTRVDKRFGEIAIEDGYLTQEQVNELLSQQAPNYMLLGQILEEKGYVSRAELEQLIVDYQSEYEIYDLDMADDDQKEMVDHLLTKLIPSVDEFTDHVTSYLELLFHNLIRFIGDDFTPLDIITLPEVPLTSCTSQIMESDKFVFESALDMDVATSISFASRYVGEEFEEMDSYIKASLEDFLNLHNGLFIVNMSNDFSEEIELHPPVEYEKPVFTSGQQSHVLPVLYPFGTIYFIWSVRAKK